jgi:uncharacterized damage-inducible protein DinB
MQNMSMAQALLAEFKQEMSTTRRCLERMPNDKLDWQPHKKSMTLGGLASHLVHLPTWTSFTLDKDGLDIAGDQPSPEPISSTTMALDVFDKNVDAAGAVLEKATDDQFTAGWTLKSGGQTIFTMPKLAVLRSFVLNHMVHHRAQLGVYLRLNDLSVPSVYGPSADENPFG